MGKMLMEMRNSNFIAIHDLENVGGRTKIAFLTCMQGEICHFSSFFHHGFMAVGNGKDAGGNFFMGMVGDLSRTRPSTIHVYCEFESLGMEPR
jgi:hypothetical protein